MIFRPADYDRYSSNKRANVVIHKYYKLNKKEKSYIHDNNDNKLFLSNSSNFTVANYEVSDQLYQTLKNHASIVSEKCPLAITFDRTTFKLISINTACEYKSLF